MELNVADVPQRSMRLTRQISSNLAREIERTLIQSLKPLPKSSAKTPATALKNALLF